MLCLLFAWHIMNTFIRQKRPHADHTIQFIRQTEVKVKFSRTRYRALGPELIPVYRQSAHR